MNTELNEWIAQNLMGYKPQRTHESGMAWTEPHGKSWRYGLPDFVNTYDGMGAVIEAMRAKGYGKSIVYSDRTLRAGAAVDVVVAEFGRYLECGNFEECGRAEDDTAPLAVALAAKAALEQEST